MFLSRTGKSRGAVAGDVVRLASDGRQARLVSRLLDAGQSGSASVIP